jgi:hypothetical protein
VLCLLANPGRAVIHTLLTDEFDDWDQVHAVAEFEEVKALGQEMDVLKGRLRRLKERDIEALFGRPTPKTEKTFAMPVPQPRGLGLSGLRHGDPKMNKAHTEFYTVGQSAAIEVYYGIDGVSPQAVLVYLRVDGEFPRLTKDNLARRLAWERERLAKLNCLFEERRAAVFRWEIDPEAEKAQYQGMESGDLADKLQAMLRWGEKQGYQLKHRPASGERTPRWEWFDKGRLMAEAYHDRGYKGDEGKPSLFVLFRPDGSRLRADGGWPSLNAVRWYREGGKTMVRYEGGSMGKECWRPTTWCWYGKDGKAIHSEWDTNGDGIPDRYRDDKLHLKDDGLPLNTPTHRNASVTAFGKSSSNWTAAPAAEALDTRTGAG